MRLTTRSISPRPRRSGVGVANGDGMHGAGLGLQGAVSGTDLEATLQPLERATMLPPAAFLEHGGARLGARKHLHRAAGSASATSPPSPSPAPTSPREIAGRSFVVVGGEDGVPRAFHNVCRHRGARLIEDGRGQGPPPHPVPVPRLVLRPRRGTSAPPRTWTRSRASTSPVTGCVEIRTAVIGGLVLVDLSGEAGRARGPRRRAPPAPRALLQRRRPRPRRDRRVRRRRQLEGDRRELQRVPPLPRRPPGAERALATT